MARILVVDDERHIRERFSLELSDDGHEVVAEESCGNLMKQIVLLKPDMLILDIKLVDCDGLEMLLLIRDDNPDIPIILCSAYDSFRHDPRALAADYYVVKSYDLTELKTRIDQALEGNAPASPGAVVHYLAADSGSKGDLGMHARTLST